mmetsp:Transcript_3968/g.7800  ORF Transcript_3968/g.7800 Transcript_3968/m.7800 type:complete len:360 (-) Transcript_3968:2414-3493(-)
MMSVPKRFRFHASFALLFFFLATRSHASRRESESEIHLSAAPLRYIDGSTRTGSHSNSIESTCTAPSTKVLTDETTEGKRVQIVTFKAENIIKSRPLPLPVSSSSTAADKRFLDEFFGGTKTINLQFADRAQVEHISNPSDELMNSFLRLNSERRIEAGLSPAAEDVTSTRIVKLVNPPMHCLGLVLHSVTHVGIQVLDGNHNDYGSRPNKNRRYPGYPELQLTLLETTFEATGPAFLVRLFYKIMRHEDNNRGGRQEAFETIGFTRIWAEPVLRNDNETNGRPQTIVFADEARLEARIRVPKLLIRLVPMSRKSMERHGSATLLKTITKDMIPAMRRLTDAYVEWLSALPGDSTGHGA